MFDRTTVVRILQHKTLILGSLALVGWAAAIGLGAAIGAARLHAFVAERDAANWRRQAGKAYTEMLQARAKASGSAVIIPAGSRIDCTMTTLVSEGRTVAKCENGTFYPPSSY